MIVGLGVDVVEVARIREALENQPRMVQRVFTEEEANYCTERKAQFQHFAGRFAAKEAALKALGTGWAEGIRWRDVEVTADSTGRPDIRFHAKALEIFNSKQAASAWLTISHASEYAVAVVVLESASDSRAQVAGNS